MSVVSLPPVADPSLPDGLVHGSVQGYESGCRSRGGCAYGPEDGYLSCAEAAIARRSDWRLASLPLDQPIPRRVPTPAPVRAAAPVRRSTPMLVEPVVAEPKEVHGTTWGYRRGCTTDRGCPHWRLGRVTCRQARREYVREYKRRRIEGNGKPIEHGTNRGYLSGCQDESRCPNRGTGTTCADTDGGDAVRRFTPATLEKLRGLAAGDEVVDRKAG